MASQQTLWLQESMSLMWNATITLFTNEWEYLSCKQACMKTFQDWSFSDWGLWNSSNSQRQVNIVCQWCEESTLAHGCFICRSAPRFLQSYGSHIQSGTRSNLFDLCQMPLSWWWWHATQDAVQTNIVTFPSTDVENRFKQWVKSWKWVGHTNRGVWLWIRNILQQT